MHFSAGATEHYSAHTDPGGDLHEEAPARADGRHCVSLDIVINPSWMEKRKHENLKIK